MIIDSIHIRNFRSILDETLTCDILTVLIGRNGSGKSSFLMALNLFYDQSAKVDEEDYYNRDTGKEIQIAITFKILSDDAKKLFASYMQGDCLTVERVFTWNKGKPIGTYHGSSKQNTEFKEIRESGGAREQRPKYEAIREKYGLPRWSNQGSALEAMKQWEENNQDKCERHRDDGKFFGFTGVGTGYLGRYTRFLFVPAVREASEDAQEGKGSLFSILMDLVVRSVIATREAYIKLKEETQASYEEIMNPDNLPELQSLGENITKTLQNFVPDAELQLSWQKLSSVDIPMPQADIKLVEDGFGAAVSRTGHGLQRAFVITSLQHLVLAQSLQTRESGDIDTEIAGKLPSFVVAIEEPELYQHPSRQRHFADILYKLATGKIPGVAEKTQILYATHSPLFVGIDRINQLRLLRKVPNEDDLPKVTSVTRTTLDDVAKCVWEANDCKGERYTDESLQARLKTIMTPWMNEGFFAEVVVLVEGPDDHAAILGVAQSKGHNFESMGICVIPCHGKANIDRPAVIFGKLDIPVYALWDGDKGESGAKPEDNHRLLRLFGKTIEDYPAFIDDDCACLEVKLENTLLSEIGPDFAILFQQQQDDLGIPKKNLATKNPVVFERTIAAARQKGKTCNTLEQIVDKVVSLKT